MFQRCFKSCLNPFQHKKQFCGEGGCSPPSLAALLMLAKLDLERIQKNVCSGYTQFGKCLFREMYCQNLFFLGGGSFVLRNVYFEKSFFRVLFLGKLTEYQKLQHIDSIVDIIILHFFHYNNDKFYKIYSNWKIFTGMEQHHRRHYDSGLVKRN